jgi:hypothetical protein
LGGQPLVEQLRARIFAPLHMQDVLDQDASHLPASDFTPEAIADFHDSLEPLGTPASFTQTSADRAAA